jgi:hypothetical protein
MVHFDFKNKRSVNPLEKVDLFFINPYEMSSAKLLCLENKVKHGSNATIAFCKGMPVVLFDLSILGLKTCVVKWINNGGIIHSRNNSDGETKIYFSWTDEENIIRINTVTNFEIVCDKRLLDLIAF